MPVKTITPDIYLLSAEYPNSMSVFQAIIIGIIQGLTEFLPISSSGHMILVGKIMDVEVTLGYELIMHLATLAAVLIVMRRQVFSLIRHPLQKKVRLLVVASVPTAVIIFVFMDFFENAFDGSMLPICFLITAVLLLAAGLKNPKKVKLTAKNGLELNDSAKMPQNGKIGYLDALIIGSVQGLAALPGLSRSGSTISTSMLLGNERDESAHFSFLLSIPVIIGSSLFKLRGGAVDAEFLPLLCGAIAAFLSGLLGLKFMLRLLKNMDIFALYLIALSIFLLLNDFWLHWI